MTWSILARDPETGGLGVAVTSFFFAVGAVVPHVRAEVGALATQAFMNTGYAPSALAMLAEGVAPDAIVDRLGGADEGRAVRQLHVLDRTGTTAGFTGERCPVWSGHLCAPNVSVAGNTLAGEAVVRATLERYRAAGDLPFERRLVAALAAGQAAGGDRRGRQSAALIVRGRKGRVDIDIRIDDHATPIDELDRLLTVHTYDYLPVARHFAGVLSATGDHDPETLARARAERMENREKGLTLSHGVVNPPE